MKTATKKRLVLEEIEWSSRKKSFVTTEGGLEVRAVQIGTPMIKNVDASAGLPLQIQARYYLKRVKGALRRLGANGYTVGADLHHSAEDDRTTPGTIKICPYKLQYAN